MITLSSRHLASGLGSLLLPAIALAQPGLDAAAPANMLVVAAGMGLGLIAMLLPFVLVYLASKRRNEVIRLLIENGREIPPELLRRLDGRRETPTSAADRRNNDIRGGIVCLFLAIGIALALYLTSGQLRSAAWSLILVFLSVGNFINAFRASDKRDPH